MTQDISPATVGPWRLIRQAYLFKTNLPVSRLKLLLEAVSSLATWGREC